MLKKISILVLGFVIIFTPISLVFAVDGVGIVSDSDCNTKLDSNGGFSDPCGFDVLLTLVNNFINYLLVYLATPIFALIIVYVAWLYLSDMGSSENIKKAKTIFKNAIIGYVIILSAWLIVKTILTSLGFEGPMFLG